MTNTTKKMMVTFDPERPTKSSSDFLAPLLQDGRACLWGTRSKKPQEYGLVVFTGRKVAPPDIFAKLVDGGAAIPSVDEQMEVIAAYIAAMKSARIGQVYRVPIEGIEKANFELEKTPLKAREKNRRLP